jgi:hypothetical protein
MSENAVAVTTLIIITLVATVMVLVIVGNIYVETKATADLLRDVLSQARAP